MAANIIRARPIGRTTVQTESNGARSTTVVIYDGTVVRAVTAAVCDTRTCCRIHHVDENAMMGAVLLIDGTAVRIVSRIDITGGTIPREPSINRESRTIHGRGKIERLPIS